MDTDRYIKKWLEGTLGKDEMEKFEKTETFKELKRISDAAKSFKPPEYNVESELNRFNHYKSGKGKTAKINWQKTILRVAAMLTIVIGGYFYITYFWPVTIETTSAEKSSIFLPDSTEIILNASTEITYNKKRWKNNRKVNLKGEAFFKVSKGSKFEVETKVGTVTVLGTQFNVKHRQDFFEVNCYEGQVRVSSEIGIGELTANHSFRIIDGKVIKGQFRNKAEPSWIKNESSFESIPFRQVIEEFERQFNVKVVTQDLDMDELFTGRFSHADMVLALKSITIPHNISYQIKGENRIILTGDIK
jgi:ferric-dicitrate binding protein FerR (iron transport regulator)